MSRIFFDILKFAETVVSSPAPCNGNPKPTKASLWASFIVVLLAIKEKWSKSSDRRNLAAFMDLQGDRNPHFYATCKQYN